MTYKYLIIDITESQLKAAIAGKRFKVLNSQLGKGTKEIALHPEQAKRVEKAALKNSAVMLQMSDGELAETYSRMMTKGSGWLGNIWKGLKKVWGVLKDSGAASTLLDMAVAPVAAYTGQPALVGAVRKGVKDLTGVGAKPRITKQARVSALVGRGLYLST